MKDCSKQPTIRELQIKTTLNLPHPIRIVKMTKSEVLNIGRYVRRKALLVEQLTGPTFLEIHLELD